MAQNRHTHARGHGSHTDAAYMTVMGGAGVRQKHGAASNVVQDFLGGLDPFGFYTADYGARNEAAGLSEGEHALRHGISTAGGIVGGGLLVPSLISGVGSAVTGAGKGGLRGALRGAVEGFKAPIQGVISARRGVKGLERIKDTGGKLDASEFEGVKKLLGQVTLGDVGEEVAPLGDRLRRQIARFKNDPSQLASEALKAYGAAGDMSATAAGHSIDAARRAKDLHRAATTGELSSELATKLYDPMRQGLTSGYSQLAMGAGVGGFGAAAQYHKGRESERDTSISSRLKRMVGVGKEAAAPHTSDAYAMVMDAAGVQMSKTAWRLPWETPEITEEDAYVGGVIASVPGAALTFAGGVPYMLEEKGIYGRPPIVNQKAYDTLSNGLGEDFANQTDMFAHITAYENAPAMYAWPSLTRRAVEDGEFRHDIAQKMRAYLDDVDFAGWVNVPDTNPAALAHELGHATPEAGLLGKLRNFDLRSRGAAFGLGTTLGGATGLLAQEFGADDTTAGLIGAGTALAPSVPMLVEEARASVRGDQALRRVLDTTRSIGARGISADDAADLLSRSRSHLGKAYGTYAGAVAGAALAAGLTPWAARLVSDANAKPWYAP